MKFSIQNIIGFSVDKDNFQYPHVSLPGSLAGN